MIIYVLLCVTLCAFKFCNHLDGEERADCFAYFVFLVSRDCCVALHRGAMGLSKICNCDISGSYSLSIFNVSSDIYDGTAHRLTLFVYLFCDCIYYE